MWFTPPMRNRHELTSLFNGEPKAPVFRTSIRNRNTDAFGLPLNESTEIEKLFRDSS